MRFRVAAGSTVCSVAGKFWGHLGYGQWRDMTEGDQKGERLRGQGENVGPIQISSCLK